MLGYRTKTITFCDQCYEMQGKQCRNPQCAFYLRTIGDIAHVLKILKIAPRFQEDEEIQNILGGRDEV